MKIRITSCPEPKSWYYKRIGDTFEVLEESRTVSGEKMYVVEKGRICNSFILDSDCIIVKK